MNRAEIIFDKLIGFYNSLLSQLARFDSKKPLKHYRAVILVLTSIIVALLLIPRITLQLPAYKVGMIVKKNIIADHDFSVIDKNAYEIKKLEAMENIHLVYDYNPDMFMLVKSRMSKAAPIFNHLHQQMLNSSTQASSAFLASARKEIEDALEMHLKPEEFETLCAYKFSPKIFEMMGDYLLKTYEGKLIGDVRPAENEIAKGILVRNVKSQTETIKKSWKDVRNIDDARRSLSQNIRSALASEDAEVRTLVEALASNLLSPGIRYNAEVSEKNKQEILDTVTPVYFNVSKNELIVRGGEKITETDVDKIEAMTRDSRKSLLSHITIFLGTFIIVLLFSFVMYLVSREWLGKREDGDRAILFTAICLILQVVITRFGLFIAASLGRAFALLPFDVFFFAIPFATSILLVALLVNRNMAVAFAVVSSIITASLFESKLAVASISLFGGIIASHHIIQCRRRSAFFRSGFIMGGVNALIIMAFAMIANDLFSLATLLRIVMGILGGFLAAFLVAGLVPLFETSFGYLTNIRLLELGNLNNEIFQRMLIEATGTYHHSIVVASMVEAAAEVTGANPLLAKTAAFYHDIGKIRKPFYFIENQKNGEDPHEKINPKMSSAVIIAHVKEGYEMAEQIGLPRVITDIIKQHHGTSLVGYFFNKAKNDPDESIRSLSEKHFSYPGPKPQTKEAALVMLADIVEASTRALTNPTPARIENLVRERITRAFVYGQLDECHLTFSDLYKIAGILTRMTIAVFHQRVGYPTDNGAAPKGKMIGAESLLAEKKE